MKKWEHVPEDEDTVILDQQTTNIEGIEVLYQKWFFEGIKAESLIFHTKDVSSLDEGRLTELAMKSDFFRKGSDITISTGDHGFTFVNFNFEVPS